MELDLSQQNFEKFHNNLFSGGHHVPCGRTDRQTWWS